MPMREVGMMQCIFMCPGRVSRWVSACLMLEPTSSRHQALGPSASLQF